MDNETMGSPPSIAARGEVAGSDLDPERPGVSFWLARSSRKLLRSFGVPTIGLSVLLSGCAANGSSPGDDPEAPLDDPPPLDESTIECGPVNPASASAQLLTGEQYDNTIAELLADTTRPASILPAENTVLGFENNAEAHRATPLLVEGLMKAAEGVAARAIAPGGRALARCTVDEGDAACAQRFVREFGKRAFRRPLTEGEALAFDRLYSSTLQTETFDRGIERVLSAVLQSPQFLYRTYARRTTEDAAVAFGPYEMASRLSYFLYNSMPDAELLSAADAGELETSEQIREQATRMLGSPRARAAVVDFHRQWLGLDRLRTLVREVAPGSEDSSLGPSLMGSLAAFAEHVYWEGGGQLASLLTSPALFVDANLAPLYGHSTEGSGFTQLDESGATRAGLLTQPALLALLSHPDQSAPILRGVFIREQLLCQPIPSPPPTVDQTPPDPSPNLSTRERFRVHTEDPTCQSCHRTFDGLGFGLENYDQLGRYRAEENGAAVDASGEIVDAKDQSLDGPFVGAIELAQKLSQSRQVSDCLSTQWYRYALGRVEEMADVCSLRDLRQAFGESGGDLQELLIEIATSDAFRYRSRFEEEVP